MVASRSIASVHQRVDPRRPLRRQPHGDQRAELIRSTDTTRSLSKDQQCCNSAVSALGYQPRRNRRRMRASKTCPTGSCVPVR